MRILGIDIGGTSIKVGLFNEYLDLIESWKYDTKSAIGGQYLFENIIKKLKKVEKINAIGICVPGQVDRESGSINGKLVNIPHVENVSIKTIFEKQFSVPVYVCNDVHAAAMSESELGIGKKSAHYLFIAYGTGIGGGIVKNNELDDGINGYAGEFGHIITHANGRKCNCGGSGCYEMYASTRALIYEAMQIDEKYNNGETIIKAFHEKDAHIGKIVETWLDEITAGLVSLVHIFNPSTLVLGGGIMENNFLITDIQARINQAILPAFRPVTVKKAILGNNAGIYGAATIAIKGA